MRLLRSVEHGGRGGDGWNLNFQERRVLADGVSRLTLATTTTSAVSF